MHDHLRKYFIIFIILILFYFSLQNLSFCRNDKMYSILCQSKRMFFFFSFFHSSWSEWKMHRLDEIVQKWASLSDQIFKCLSWILLTLNELNTFIYIAVNTTYQGRTVLVNLGYHSNTSFLQQ